LYGIKGNKILTVKTKDFEKMFEEIGEHSIINLNIDNKDKAEVIVKDFQLDPVTKHVIHIDFLEFEKGKALKTEVPIHVIGNSKGVKVGGILETFLHDLEIECLPRDIPNSVVIDVTHMDIGDSLHARDITVEDKIKILTNPEQVVIAIGMPTKIEEPVEEEEAVPAEGEVPAEEAEDQEAAPEPDQEKK
ncbi:MAG: 50S ribosomal protein L25, partial [Spirochaetes bacterium]|nr:50S ribosomal protein L25 [Spirochaetota bacterium]